MKFNFRRLATIAIVLALLALIITKCVPEKKVDLSSKVVPIAWINENSLLVRIGNDYFIRTENGELLPSRFDAVQPVSSAPLKFQLTIPEIRDEEVASDGGLKKTDPYILMAGQKHRVERPDWNFRFYGYNQGFPRGEYVDFLTYLHLGRVGLVTSQNGKVQETELPLFNDQNRSPPGVKQDISGDKFFAFQTRCARDDPEGTCTRTAWWLDSALKVRSSFLLPTHDPLFTEEKLSCFSCGCGCYTQEDVYAVNGQAFFLYSGFPLKWSQRGLYKVIEHDDGRSEWLQVIKGRVEPPLSFSPSGCRVAYFRVSRFGDRLEVRELC